ncbi:MAG: hypothetical protein JST42_21055 [Bacteroidetes bacterium]|nr:hypothetical protein [Bacteroidota bacterium]
MTKSASDERIRLFQEDLALLRKMYKNWQIAKALEIDPTNLSSYRSGKKPPGNAFLDKFYKTFGTEIEEMKKKEPYKTVKEEDPANDDAVTGEPAVIRHIVPDDKDDHIVTLKKQSSHLQKNYERIEEDLRIALENDNLHAKNYDRLIRTNEKLVDHVLATNGQSTDK